MHSFFHVENEIKINSKEFETILQSLRTYLKIWQYKDEQSAPPQYFDVIGIYGTNYLFEEDSIERAKNNKIEIEPKILSEKILIDDKFAQALAYLI